MSSSEPLNPFWGGLLYNSCLPLQVTLNYCGQCVYCFADLADPDRKNSPRPVLELLRTFRDRNKDGTYKRKSYTAHLLREGYPVVASNLVDPLSKTNYKAFAPIQAAMELQGVPYSIQTKVGHDVKPAYEVLRRCKKPLIWYISVTTLLDDRRKSIEPGASAIPDRLQFIQDARAAGHRVLVGINPVIPDNIPDPEALIGELKRRGVEGIWVQGLHLSANKQQNLGLYGKKALGEEVLEAAKKPLEWSECLDTIEAIRVAADRAAMPHYDSQQGGTTSYFDPYRETYRRTFPLMQDFVNYCHQNKAAGDLIYWQEFVGFFEDKLPRGYWSLREHLCAIAHRMSLIGLEIPQQMTYGGVEAFHVQDIVARQKRDRTPLLLEIWKWKETIICPANVECFAWIGSWETQKGGSKGWTQYLDDDGLPILRFCPDGSDGSAFVEY